MVEKTADEHLEHARKLDAIRRQGKCPHGWTQAAHPDFAPHLKGEQLECMECGDIFQTTEEWNYARSMLLDAIG